MTAVPKADYLFETSWEVCNKVGGIYTVVKSKLEQSCRYYHNHYCLIGPYLNNNQDEFSEKPIPPKFKPAFDSLKAKGVICHFGKWMAQPEPDTILVEFQQLYAKKNEIKGHLWDTFRVDSLFSHHDFEEPVVWATAVGMLLEEISKVIEGKIVAHFHEWLSGAALLYLKSHNSSVRTVFTTHATMLGRSIAGSGDDLYSMLGKFEPFEEAKKRGVQDKHSMEFASASNCDVFTTVSEITSIEAEHLLKRKADVLLPNGLEIDKFPYFEESSIKHRTYKADVYEFIMYSFFPYYTFNLDHTLVFFTCARYEYKNKGFDVLIKALGKLNQRLIEEKSNKTIVVFFWVPANVGDQKKELLQNRNYYKDFTDSIDDNLPDIRNRLVSAMLSKAPFTEKNIFQDDLYFELQRKLNKISRKDSLPSLSTHDIYGAESDPILNGCKDAKLNNTKDDRVKIVFYPVYLTGADALLNLSYYEGMMASNLGIFPSYYEPWGYTPLEAAALGITSITTDLAGFGRYIEKFANPADREGINVIKRHNRNDEEVARDLELAMYHYSTLSKRDRIGLKIKAANLASLADWKNMIVNYIQAHNLAVDKR